MEAAVKPNVCSLLLISLTVSFVHLYLVLVVFGSVALTLTSSDQQMTTKQSLCANILVERSM